MQSRPRAMQLHLKLSSLVNLRATTIAEAYDKTCQVMLGFLRSRRVLQLHWLISGLPITKGTVCAGS